MAPLGSDVTPPTGTMSVNSGAAYTGTTAATVNSAVTDNVGVTQMRIDPGTGTYGAWIAYAATYAITLPAGTGTKTVRVAVPRRGGQRPQPDRHDRPRRHRPVHDDQHHAGTDVLGYPDVHSVAHGCGRLGRGRHLVAARRYWWHVDSGYLGDCGGAGLGNAVSYAVLVLARRCGQHRAAEVSLVLIAAPAAAAPL